MSNLTPFNQTLSKQYRPLVATAQAVFYIRRTQNDLEPFHPTKTA